MNEKTLEDREAIVMMYLTDAKANAEEADNFDNVICDALGIDKSEYPPDFIYDAIIMGCGQ